MRIAGWWGITIALLLLVGSGHAQAVSTLSFRAVATPTKNGKGVYGRVYSDGKSIITLGKGATAAQAAATLASRLNALAAAGLKASQITVRKEGRRNRNRGIYARGVRVLSIDKKVAKANGASVSSLATKWLGALQKEFKRPYLSAQPPAIPLGETRLVTITGNIVGHFRVETDSNVATGAWEASEKAVRIVGANIGRATLTIRDEKSTLRLPVRVAKYAARLDSPIFASVTGSPATNFALESAVASAVQAAIHPEPGASCEIYTRTGSVTPPAPGKATQVNVIIVADGEEYLPYRAQPTVTVTNQPLALAPVSMLMVSNSPEKLLSYGLWFEGTLSDNSATRLLYHHVNATATTAQLAVELWNLGTEPAQVHVLAGLGGPSLDELWVGHRAANAYLHSFVNRTGWFVSVPAGQVMTLFSHTMPARSIASGIVDVRALGAANLSLRVYLNPTSTPVGLRPFDRYQPSPLLGEWQYPQPLRQVKAKYSVGGGWAFVTIGDQAAVGVKDGDRLLGSYGVLYEIELTLTNPTDTPAQTSVMLEPAGGVARGCLLVDGRVAETSVLRNGEEAPVASYLLAPGETRTVKILTLPQSGSNYPVRLVARSL